MKNSIIFHGTSGTEKSFWIPWLKKQLEANAYKVFTPNLPDTDNPNLTTWLPYVIENYQNQINQETILIGHSAGCPLILAFLEKINIQVKKVILVAGFTKSLIPNEKMPILKDNYNWSKIKQNAKSFITINSKNDPWGCDHNAGLEIFDGVGGTLILREDAGHMGSDTYKQPYKEFPLLIELVESGEI